MPHTHACILAAADQGHLAILDAIHEDEFQSIHLCRGAAAMGSLRALEYLQGREPACPWDNIVPLIAIRDWEHCTLQWLMQQSPPCPIDLSICAAAAAVLGQEETLDWLRSSHPEACAPPVMH